MYQRSLWCEPVLNQVKLQQHPSLSEAKENPHEAQQPPLLTQVLRAAMSSASLVMSFTIKSRPATSTKKLGLPFP